MLNELVLVGRLANEIRINKTETGKKIGNLTLAVPRSFKNMDGLYETVLFLAFYGMKSKRLLKSIAIPGRYRLVLKVVWQSQSD